MLGYADIAAFGLVEVGKEDGGTDGRIAGQTDGKTLGRLVERKFDGVTDGHRAGNDEVGWVRVGVGVRLADTDTIPYRADRQTLA